MNQRNESRATSYDNSRGPKDRCKAEIVERCLIDKTLLIK